MTQTEDDIQLTIWGTGEIYLPIPPQNSDTNTPFELGISVVNGTLAPWPFSEINTLIPELQGPDGSILKDLQRDNRRLDARPQPLSPGQQIVITRSARLRYSKRMLLLEIFYGLLYRGYGNPHSESFCWSFTGLKSGTHYLRFAYRSDRHLKSERPKTPAFALHLIDLPRTDSHTITAKDVCFETIVPQPVLRIPNQETNVTIPVQFGLRVTNLSLTPYRFTFFHLMPELQDATGQILQRNYGRNATKSPRVSDYMLLAPQEDLTFTIDGQLSCHNSQLTLAGYEGGGGVWSFQDLQPGTYRVRFTYLSHSNTGKVLVMSMPLRDVFNDLWVGMACTPFVEFHLVRSSTRR